MGTHTWTPLIEPSSQLGARALAALESATGAAMDSNGHLDVAVLLAYRALADGNSRWMKLAVERLNAGIARADGMYSAGQFELFGGLSGLGWVAEHVIRLWRRFHRSEEYGASRINDDTDSALLLELQRGRWQGTCDLTTGLTGIGLYFLQRMPAKPARQGLELVIGHLEVSPFLDGGAGVGRGLAGTLSLLEQSAAAGVDAVRARRLFADGSKALLDRLRECRDSCGWSEGALGIAAVCSRWAPKAFSHLIDGCLEAAPGGADPGLLNGAAGVGHMWNRISQMTGDDRCREASLKWWTRAIKLYETTTPAADAAGVEFLAGSAGVALAILAALTPFEPVWDGLLCLSRIPQLIYDAD